MYAYSYIRIITILFGVARCHHLCCVYGSPPAGAKRQSRPVLGRLPGSFPLSLPQSVLRIEDFAGTMRIAHHSRVMVHHPQVMSSPECQRVVCNGSCAVAAHDLKVITTLAVNT